MEAFASQVGGSATGVASLFLLSKFMLWWYRRRVSGLLLLKGKTSICKELSNEKLLFIDLDEYLEKHDGYADAKENKSKMMLLYTKIRGETDKMIRSYQKPVVFVSRHRDLLKVLGINKHKLWFVCASKDAHAKSQLLYDDPEEFARDEAERLRLLREFDDKHVRVFDMVADITRIVKSLFNVKITRTL